MNNTIHISSENCRGAGVTSATKFISEFQPRHV